MFHINEKSLLDENKQRKPKFINFLFVAEFNNFIIQEMGAKLLSNITYDIEFNITAMTLKAVKYIFALQ